MSRQRASNATGPSRRPGSRAALLAVLLTASGAVVGASQAAPQAAPRPAESPPERALWIWSRPSPAHVRVAARHGFDTVYVQLRPGRTARRELRTLTRAATRRGISVWGLGGRPEWVLDAAPLARFVRAAARTPGLAGIVLDVEPHALPGWRDPRDRRRLMRGFLRALNRARTAAGEARLRAAVPFWYDHDGYHVAGRSLVEGVLQHTDGVVVMAYRDRAAGRDGIIALAAGEVLLAGKLGKQAVVSVQTSPDELDKLSFAEEGRAAMEAELADVVDALTGDPGFGGVAVHHFDSFRQLRAR